jgi:predicted alpha-1,6-mannanase (GH76 family)
MLSPMSLRISAIFSIVITLCSALPHPAPAAEPRPQKHQIGDRLGKRATSQDYLIYAVAGINQLQTWYSAADGLYNHYWWPSANVVTMLADFQDYFPTQGKAITDQVFPTTLSQAPNSFAGFLNGYYDDELWWALAWIKVYDVTGETKYLDTAATIFEDAKSAWGTSPCGGLWYVSNLDP